MPQKRKTTVRKTAKKIMRSSRNSRVKSTSRSAVRKQNNSSWTESYSSFLLGIVVVIVAVLFGVSLIRQQSHMKQQATSISTGPSISSMPSPTPGMLVNEGNRTYYIVKANDSLWSIAVNVYNDGYKWTQIAQANNLVNPDYIFKGDKLLIPNAPKPSELGQLMHPQQVPDATIGKSYTVKKGDDLWHIAVRAYGDGYQWVKIARANSLSNPDLIFSGNVLQIPR